MSASPAISQALRRRILRARKTVKPREFELMQLLRPERPAVVAEGDSWFAYPSRTLLGADSRSNVINWLTRIVDLNLLQLASNGDEAVQMLCGASKHRLIGILERFRIDVLLFSGGGNDIVGHRDFDFLLRDGLTVESDDCRAYLHADRVERRMTAIDLAYRELVAFCDEYSRNPAIRVVAHCYDYATPSAQGALFLGGLVRPDGGRSWMLPALEARHVPQRHHAAIACHLIDELADRLLALEAERPDRLQVVDTRGLLGTDEWINEIHPDSGGFGKIARQIVADVRRLQNWPRGRLVT